MLERKRRIAAAIIAATMVSVLAGCSQPVEKNKTDVKNEEKPTLKALMPYMKEDYNTYPSARVLEERTGYKVQYDMLPQDRPNDILNLNIASGRDYDFIGSISRERYTDFAQQGALTDVEELVDKYGDNIKKNIQKETFDALRVNGKVYTIPTTAVTGTGKDTISYMLAIRQDWLDKLGLKMPATVDDLTNILQQFKDKDPGNNGVKNIPLVTGQVPNLPGVGGAFGVITSWTDINGQLVPAVLNPGYKDHVAYVADLYKKGLLDKEFPTNQPAMVTEKFTSGRAGVMAMAWHQVPAMMDALKKNKPEAKINFIQPLAGKDGKAGIGVGDIRYTFDRLSAIPAASKNKEHVIKYFDLKLDEEIFKEYTIGKEGEHYTVKDGQYLPISPKLFDERGSAMNFLTGATANYGKYWLARLKKDERVYDAYMLMNVEYQKFHVIDPTAPAPPMPVNARNGQVLTQLTQDFFIKSVVGATPAPSYDNFIKDWRAKGGDDNVKEMNDWYKTVKK